MQHAACSMQHAACKACRATFKSHAVCEHHATDNMQHATDNMQHATFHATCDGHHATCKMPCNISSDELGTWASEVDGPHARGDYSQSRAPTVRVVDRIHDGLAVAPLLGPRQPSAVRHRQRHGGAARGLRMQKTACQATGPCAPLEFAQSTIEYPKYPLCHSRAVSVALWSAGRMTSE